MATRTGLNRVSILGVPVDILPDDGFEDLVASLDDGSNHQIVLLSVWDLMRAKSRMEFRTMIAGASLVVPISPSIVKAARFLRKKEPKRYEPFAFAIRLLGELERRGKSTFLLGATPTILRKAESNLKATFPGLRIVGRHEGYYSRQSEGDIVEAVRKSSPSLLLVGKGVPGGERWIPRRLPDFSSGLYLWCSDLFWVFSRSRSRPSGFLSGHGLGWFRHFLRRPWRAWRLFVFAAFKLLVLLERLEQR